MTKSAAAPQADPPPPELDPSRAPPEIVDPPGPDLVPNEPPPLDPGDPRPYDGQTR
ncbi:hypothetical protein [Caulobacter hibisci]|uniref:Uncharacterized protein n=1 Tax=Caulobacter hibisci TaxID=2035993 RepID=A0ABS0SX30_9CAUL|nr:hypothetical protein [Caulobacter hibisci]MBI1684185.1 hypothetical protein [Caulobacter hibisci]